MRSSTRSTVAIVLGAVSLAAVLVYLAIKSNREYREAPTLARAPTASPLRELPVKLEVVAAGHTVYVPVYSHVYSGRGRELALTATLSIRNTDLERPIVIDSVQYFDNDGRLLKNYLERSVVLDPLASTDFLVEQRDMAGGVGANFLVHWVAEHPVSLPIVEAIMLGSEGNRAFAFARPGRSVATVED